MKRNQFFLTATRLLVKLMFFYVLGIVFGNYMQKESLFIDVDETITSFNLEVDDDCDKIAVVSKANISLENVKMYTYVKSHEFVAHMMNTLIMYIPNELKAKSLDTNSETNYAHVINAMTLRPPRGDQILINTS